MHDTNLLTETHHVHRLLTRARLRIVLPYLALGILLVITIVVLGRDIDHHLDAIETWIAGLGPWGVLAFVVLFVLGTSILLPDTILCVIAGTLFGMAWGAVAIVIGALLAATLQCALARRLLRTRIEQTLAARPSLAAIERAVLRDEFRLQVLLRLAPLNPAIVSYLLGAAGVRLRGFLIACLALLPNCLIEVYFGHAGKHLARLASSNGSGLRLHDFAIIGGAAVGVTVMVIVARLAHRAVMQAAATSEIGQENGRESV